MSKFPKGKEFEKAPEGNHPSVCVGIYDIGTQKVTFQDKPKDTRQCILVMQLVEEKTSEGENVTIGNTYTFSAGPKSNFGKLLKPWVGGNPEELDPATLLLRQGMTSVVHGTSKAGKTYAGISAITAPPKGVKIQKPTEPASSFFFSYEEDEDENPIPESVTFDEEDFKSCPDWVKKKIVASEEYPIALANIENGGWENPNAKGKKKVAAKAAAKTGKKK